MPSRRLLLFVTPLAFLLSGVDCLAQGRTTGATSGSAGTTRFGSTGFGTSSLGSSLGGSSLGQSSLGSASSGLGSSGATFGANTTGTGNTQGFVGRAGSDLESFFGGIGAAVEQFERGDRSGRRDADAPEVRRPEVRVRLTVSPEFGRQTVAKKADAGAALTTVARALARKKIDTVRMSSADGVTVLEGTVRSDSERRLVEKLVAIEPGIRTIDNRLTIAESPNDTLPAPR